MLARGVHEEIEDMDGQESTVAGRLLILHLSSPGRGPGARWFRKLLGTAFGARKEDLGLSGAFPWSVLADFFVQIDPWTFPKKVCLKRPLITFCSAALATNSQFSSSAITIDIHLLDPDVGRNMSQFKECPLEWSLGPLTRIKQFHAMRAKIRERGRGDAADHHEQSDGLVQQQFLSEHDSRNGGKQISGGQVRQLERELSGETNSPNKQG